MDEEFDFICPRCENSDFLDSGEFRGYSAWYTNIEHLFSEEFLLSLEPTIDFNEDKKTLYCRVCVNVPKSIELISEKISYIEKPIFEIRGGVYLLKADFDLESLITDDEVGMYKSLNDINLLNRNKYIIANKNKILKKLHTLSKSNILKKTQSLEQFEFFLTHDNLLDLEFYSWKEHNYLPKSSLTILDALDFVMNYRKEKTLRKLVFEDYKMQMRKHSYDFMYIYTITRCIKNVNILNRLIQINLKPHIEEMNNSYNFYQFIEFLSTKFTEKQTEKLFLEYEENETFWLVDTVDMFSSLINYCDDLQDLECKFFSLHNELSIYHRIFVEEDLFEILFQYDERFAKSCIHIEDYQIKLPQNGKELYDWSNHLQNCLSGYGKRIQGKETIVFGFFKDDKIKFVVEIKDNKIAQASSKYNKDLQDEEKILILRWFKKYFEIDENSVITA